MPFLAETLRRLGILARIYILNCTEPRGHPQKISIVHTIPQYQKNKQTETLCGDKQQTNGVVDSNIGGKYQLTGHQYPLPVCSSMYHGLPRYLSALDLLSWSCGSCITVGTTGRVSRRSLLLRACQCRVLAVTSQSSRHLL